VLLGPLIRKNTGKNIAILMVSPKRKDLIAITALCEGGQVVPVIDKRFSLCEVPEAFRYIIEGRAQGKVVITVAADGD
jgi:NADPH:quinone reductase-like Zn-dependent oxidoreductase